MGWYRFPPTVKPLGQHLHPEDTQRTPRDPVKLSKMDHHISLVCHRLGIPREGHIEAGVASRGRRGLRTDHSLELLRRLR